MPTLEIIPFALSFLMSDLQTGGGGAVSGDANAGGDFAGRDSSRYDSRNDSNVHINFDRALNWDEEREVLTDRQRIRDLEIYVFGDRRGLTIGIIKTLRNYLIWLIINSVSNVLLILLMAVLIWALLRGAS